MATKPVDIGSLKKGNYVVIEGIACKVSDIQVSRPGKHGHAKIRLTGVGLVDSKEFASAFLNGAGSSEAILTAFARLENSMTDISQSTIITARVVATVMLSVLKMR